MNEIEKAELTLKNLENIRKHLIQEQSELANERGRVALAAHSGDAKSRKRLDEINIAATKFASEFSSIESAIVEADKNLDAARAAETLAADREKAKQLRDKVKRFLELAETLDDCFADFKSAAMEQKKILDDIHNLGQAAPSAQQYRVFCEIALKTAVQQTPFWSQDFPAMAPNQRKSYRDVCNSWGEMIMRNVNSRLGENKEERAA
jgi:DNA repair exonuclease SbcCD ATPase subunit